jgi:hypothetical protein
VEAQILLAPWCPVTAVYRDGTREVLVSDL